MSKEQDAIFFRNFALILVALTVFGVFAGIVGRHFASQVPRDAPTTAEAPAAEGTVDE